MKQIEIFYLAHCPYCRMARRAVEELSAERGEYAALPIRWIEESEESELADSYDYYRVPAVFCAGEKLYEASPVHGYDTIKSRLRKAFDAALT